MRNIILLLALSWPCFGQSWTTTGFGFGFRGTCGAIADAPHTTSESNCTNHQAYLANPVVDGVTLGFGWEGGNASTFDAISTDSRIYGINYTVAATTRLWRVDLPATGTYTIWAAIGTASGTGVASTVKFYDGGTVSGTNITGGTLLATPADGTVTEASGQYTDAAGNHHITAAAMIASGTAPAIGTSIVRTFGTTVFHVLIGGPSATSHIAYIAVKQGGTLAVPLRRRAITQ